MRAIRWLLLASLVIPAIPLSAQTAWVYVNRRGPTNVVLVDLNTASKDELMALPSIGNAEAERIIKGRPYESKQRLLDEKIVTRELYDLIEKRVTTIAPPPKSPPFPGFGQPLFTSGKVVKPPALTFPIKPIDRPKTVCGMRVVEGSQIDPKIARTVPSGDFKLRILETPACR